ncbi:MAG TPA: ATP-dependent DNA helicase UvrD2 [Candidatus Limnocylindrales bacterium]|nr:ATP-dependent DNA helicase UvrD2 [Candidatus Limnocylindrales bacterium]
MPPVAPLDDLLDGLNGAQLEAVRAVEGPVAIIAGAGTGKTRVISRRAAHAIASGVVPADQALVVTFTDKAAGEMVERLARLGLPGVTARTFHAHALSQLRHFWPLHHDGAPLPAVLESKLAILIRLARGLPGHYRFTAAKDLADEIEWAKSRRLAPRTYADAADRAGREPPLPMDLFVRVFTDYERAKERAGRLDFDDMLLGAVDLLETDEDAVEIVRSRKRWFSVDEYQDTNPLQERLLELWLGDRRDICVVGDADQTIYTFTGATSSYLTTFADRHPGARTIELMENYRSSPEVLEVANRLLASAGSAKRLVATRPSGPAPTILRHRTGEEELGTIARRIGELIRDGVQGSEIAVLVRTNAQLASVEAALTRAGITYRVRGAGFYRRPEVRAAIDLVRRGGDETGPALAASVRAAFAKEFGHEEGAAAAGDEARERAAALDTILGIVDDLVAGDDPRAPVVDRAAVAAELDRRAAAERSTTSGGVELATYHRAKGLEWDAVFLPMLEEGSLPIRHAADDVEALDEERRLLYVGITRARIHLALSWADRRETRGRETSRQPSRFLDGLQGAAARSGRSGRSSRSGRVVRLPDAFATSPRRNRDGTPPDSPLLAALRAWRSRRAREDGVPAFVVAHDTTLAAIAEARPASAAALRRVKGMGPTKLERYGDEILAVVEAGPTIGGSETN